MMLTAIPLLLVPVIAYNVVVFVASTNIANVLFSIQMVSGAVWPFSVSDLLISLAVAALLVEIIKATRTGTVSLIDHALSTLLFIGCLIEFLLVPQAATSTFFIITLIAFIDMVAGYSVTIRAARRDVAVGPGDFV